VSRILIRHADVLATMDDSGGEAGREIADGAIAFENG
jgi:hypothetical protein